MRKVGALLAVLGGSLVLAQAANATLPAKGANFQCGYAASTQSTVLSDMLSAGSAWTRVSVDWNSLEAAGRNVWSSSYLSTLTSCFTAIHTYDSNVLIVLGPHTPNWAAASGCNNANGLCPPANDLYYEEAAAKLAQTFPASNGSDGINAFEFWNEPNSGSFWAGTAPEYGAMEADGYAGVKAHSTATTVFGGTSHFAYSWLQQAIQYGQFDVLGVHPYPNDATDYYDNPAHYLNLSGSNNSLTGYRSLLCTYGPDGCSTPIWFTESGFIVDGGPQLSFSQIADGLDGSAPLPR